MMHGQKNINQVTSLRKLIKHKLHVK